MLLIVVCIGRFFSNLLTALNAFNLLELNSKDQRGATCSSREGLGRIARICRGSPGSKPEHGN